MVDVAAVLAWDVDEEGGVMATDTVAQSISPECDKLASLASSRDVLNEFRDWLSEQGIVLCTIATYETGFSEYVRRDWGGHEGLIFDFLGIDTAQLDVERREMLARLRQHRRA